MRVLLGEVEEEEVLLCPLGKVRVTITTERTNINNIRTGHRRRPYTRDTLPCLTRTPHHHNSHYHYNHQSRKLNMRNQHKHKASSSSSRHRNRRVRIMRVRRLRRLLGGAAAPRQARRRGSGRCRMR